jgi:hypothetical protein
MDKSPGLRRGRSFEVAASKASTRACPIFDFGTYARTPTFRDKILVRVGRQNDNCGFWDLLLDLLCRLKAVDERHSDIQDDDIWPYSLNLLYRFRSVLSFSADLKMRMLL